VSVKALIGTMSVCVTVIQLAAGETMASVSGSYRSQRLGDAFMVDTGVTPMPPELSQYSYGAASNGNGWRVMWADERDYSVGTNGIGADGSLLDLRGAVVGHDSYMRGGLVHSIVGTGSGFVAVWTSRTSPGRIWASRLDSAGALLDSVVIYEDSSNQVYPAVTFDGDSTCFVLWTVSRASDRDIYAARLTTTGQVLDTIPFAIAQDSLRREAYPAAAYGQGVFLVAWTVYDSGWVRPRAKAIRVSSDGVVLDTAIYLRHDPASDQSFPALAFGDSCFLVAWSEGTSWPDIYAARVSASGDLIDTMGTQLSSSPLRDWSPSVGFDGTRFLVAWEEVDTTVVDNSVIRGRRVTVDGVPLDSSMLRLGPTDRSCRYPSVAADRSSFLVAFCSGNDGCYVRVSPEGAVLDSGTIFPLAADAQTGPNVASDGTDFLAVWTEPTAQGQSAIRAARIRADGTLLDPVGFTVSSGPGSKSNVATGYGDSLFLVVWRDCRNDPSGDLYCARVSHEGQVVDTSGIAVCDESLSQASPDVSFDGQNFLLVWYDYRSGSSGDIYAARVSPGGVVLDPDGFAVSADSCTDAWPTICFTDTHYLVAWGSGFSVQGPYDIYSALVSRDGVVTKPRFLVSGATGNQRFPAVASGPTGSFVAWVDSRLPDTKPDIFGARVSTDGTVLDPNGLEVAAISGQEQLPKVASDAAGFRVVWSRWAPSAGTVFTTGRLDTAGRVNNVSDWFGVPGSDPSVGYDAAYGSGPELLLLYDFWTDTAAGRFYGSHRLWGKLGDVPGIEQAEGRHVRRVAGGASVLRGVLLLPRDMTETTGVSDGVPRFMLLDVSGRKVLDLRPGANDVRALAPGVYFVREAQAQAQAIRKVVVTR
jgi:hypothetical protein